MCIILAIPEVKTRRIEVPGQPGQKVCETTVKKEIPIKAGHGGSHLSLQLLRKQK
jgi:hypothetical protein